MKTKVSYTFEEHLVERQAQAEAAFLAAFEEAKPSLEEAHLIPNPYLINPLSALILFKTDAPVSVTLTVHGKRNDRENIVHTFAEATSHVIPVLGLYEDLCNKVTVALSSGESKTFTIKTAYMAGACHCRNINTSADYMGDNFMFLTAAGKNVASAYDYAGDIRWMFSLTTLFAIKRLKNGHILTGSPRFCRLSYYTTGLWEMDLLGKVYKEYRMPGWYHHDQFEMPDGNILALTEDAGSSTVEDMLVLLDRETGAVLKTWDFKDALPQDVGGSGSQDAHDWFHNNAVWYDEATDSISLSGRHQDAVINLDYQTGALKWIIGDPEGWPEDMQKYFFKPVGDVANFDWQYEQHACVVCPDGSVMMFDNGQYRSKVRENYIENKDNFSRGVRYRIDTEKMEIEQLWQYGKELGQDFFSPYICNVDFYAEGHYMVHSGGIAYVDGFASRTLGAYLDKTNPSNNICSKTIEEKDGVVMYSLEVEGNFYRANKMPIYHDGANLVLGKGAVIGDLDITPTFDVIPEMDDEMDLPPSWHDLTVLDEDDRILLTATFEPGTMVMAILESAEDTRGYFVNTARVNFLAMCSGAFLEKDPRTVKQHISKRTLSGKYELKLIINDKKYQTGISILCK